jgi:flagellar biosynthesis/type III secretory pathway chaperone
MQVEEMPAKFNELIDILEKEQGLLSEFERILKNEGDNLTGFKRKALDQSNNELENLSLQMSILEQSRALLVEKLAKYLGVPQEEASLAYLANAAPRGLGERLTGLRRLIRKTAGSVQRLQDRNRLLITNGMRIIQGLRKVVDETVNPKVIYGPQGLQKDSPGNYVSGRRV